MPVRTLFEMTLGETLFLNAKLPTGKEFMPREISLLMGKKGIRSAPRKYWKAVNRCSSLKSLNLRRR